VCCLLLSCRLHRPIMSCEGENDDYQVAMLVEVTREDERGL
jgi:hypothetical protein